MPAFDRIIHVTDTVEVAGEAVGTVALGALTATLAAPQVVPGTVSLVGATETYTDPAGDGVLAGSVSGVGTVDYVTGAVAITGGTNEAVVGAYSQWSPSGVADTDMANAVTPMFMSFRNEAGAGGLLLQASSDGTNYNTIYSRAEGSWWHSDIGLVPLAWLRVYSTSRGRLIGRPVNPT